MQQVVYVDILIFLNTVVTFILLLTVRRFAGIETGPWRLMLASCIGGVYSLVLLAPKMSFWLAAVAKLLMCVTIVLVAFRTHFFRKMLRCIFLFSGFSFLYAGVIYAVSFTLGSRYIQVNNGFAYYDLSYTAVIVLCVILYFILSFIKRSFFSFSSKDMIYPMELRFGERTFSFSALLDSGNQLRDLYSGRPVILVNADLTRQLTGFGTIGDILSAMENRETSERFRLLPVSTLNSTKLLPAATAEAASMIENGEKRVFPQPCVVFSDDPLGEDRYQALINETLLNEMKA